MPGAGYAEAGLAAFDVINGLQQADMIRAQSRLSQRVADINAANANQDAFEAEANGLTQTERYASVIDQTISKQQSNFAAKKVDSGFGTAAAVGDDTRLTGFLNTVDMQNQARAKALGLQRQARSISMNAQFSAMEQNAKAAQTEFSGLMSAGKTLASGYSRGDFGGGGSGGGGSGGGTGGGFFPANYAGSDVGSGYSGQDLLPS